MPRPLSGALLCAALAPACRGHQTSASEPELALSSAPPAQVEPDVAGEALKSLEQGRIEEARALLEELLLDKHLERARRALASGSPEEALNALDEAQELAPEAAEVRLLRADACLRLAEERIRVGRSDALVEGALEDALASYRSLPESLHALLGASRAAWFLGRTELALELARRALDQRATGPGDLGALDLAPERVHAEQVWAAYARARSQGDEDTSALFREAEEALARSLGRASDDAWSWGTLADLYQREGRLAEARDALMRGLARTPEDEGLLERLARVTTELEGPAGCARAFESHLAIHGELPRARWHLCVARFEEALAAYQGNPRQLDPAPFAASEAAFAALAEQHPGLAEPARGYEVVSRLARGWCAFHAGSLERARREFLGMNEILPRGIEWSLEGQLESGIQGLYRVADAHAQRSESLAAGEVFETLRSLEPASALWANNAGFFLREAAIALELEGQKLCRGARGLVPQPEALEELRALAGLGASTSPDAERAAFERAADERFQQARALMTRSWAAYRPAAELAPGDVRIVNDAALVQVFYLHDELGWAKEALERCVVMGGEQLAALRAELAEASAPERQAELESELSRLNEAWGDAHQNLGVLAWVHEKEAARARAWLERSIEIWPARQSVINSLLPQVRGELAPQPDDPWDLLRWAEPCPFR